MSELIERLRNEQLNLLIIKQGVTLYSSFKSGLAPLLESIERIGQPMLTNSTVVDKIVGKAAALLISYFRAEEVHTLLLSKGGISVLKKYKIKYFSINTVKEIMNKNGTDICPFEKMVIDIEDPIEGYKKIINGLE